MVTLMKRQNNMSAGKKSSTASAMDNLRTLLPVLEP